MELIIIILGILLDRVSKIWAVKVLAQKDEIVIIKNIFSFSYLENRGAAFGILQNKVIFLTIITFIVLAGIVFYIIKYKPTSRMLRVGLALIIAGALGNLVDRVYYKYVVDFILVHYKDSFFPTFNLADSMVVIGTALLAFCIIREGN